MLNRIPTKVLHNKSSYEVLYGHAPDLTQLEVFGCLSYASTLPSNRHNFDPRARKCAFFGYKTGMKGFILVDVHSTKILISRNVKFFDLEFPFHSSIVHTIPNTHIYLETIVPFFSKKTNTHEVSDDLISTPEADTASEAEQLDVVPGPNDEIAHPEPVRRSHRVSNPPSHLKDYICSSKTYPIANYVAYSQLSPQHQAYALSLTSEVEPANFQAASKGSRWVATMDNEIRALNENNTWDFVDLPPNAVTIGSKWIYKIKRHADGAIEQFKARLVAQGFTQTEGLDYFETFSPVAKLSTVRVLLAFASIQGWHLHQLDVNNAFLHGDLNESVDMRIPQGVVSPKSGQVCKLKKSLYGLKQVSRQWFEKLTKFLFTHGFTQAASDHTLFIKSTSTSFTVILVYVDDIILAGTSLDVFDDLKAALHKAFCIKKIGAPQILSWFGSCTHF